MATGAILVLLPSCYEIFEIYQLLLERPLFQAQHLITTLHSLEGTTCK